ncbi:SgcJ/EcaC family oxidoreductase [Bradyrhizobium sp. URHD0069]|uniref:SgcJ/EcaC family oxidoreductase n=1 Tax=Bradyrhizobium sp. URHD0069 TaxID=1380355 RepID=UPI000497F2D4|nr:SgcJ/EcaC family oxidoreductase [Bradyrhizobium sp. URHD0069]
MPSSLKATSAGFALSIVLLSFANVASAGPKEDVAAAASTWAVALGEDDPDKVLPLYSDDAVLWGTLSPTVRSDRAALRDYFVAAFKVLPGLKVAFGDQLIRVYGSTAVNTGYYTFSYVKDGETKSLPARYSFTYVKSDDNWLIVDHHSSAMPSAAK